MHQNAAFSAIRRALMRLFPSLQPSSIVSIEADWGFARLRDASPTTPNSLRVGSELRCVGGVTFAQDCNFASPCASAATVADSAIVFVVAKHAGVLIIEIDLTTIGSVSRTVPIVTNPAR